MNIYFFCRCKFKNNAHALCMQPLPPDAIKICSLQTQKTSTLTSQVFQHEQICTSNRLIRHCAWPVNRRRISRAKSRARAHKAIFDDTLAHGETLSNSLASRGERPGESQPLNRRAKFFFSARGEGAAPLILRKRRQQRKPLQIPAPPIGPPLALHQSGSCLRHQPFPT